VEIIHLRRLATSKHFQKQLKKLSPQDQEKALITLKDLLSALTEGTIPAGYGFKKINGDKYEIRVDIRKRIVMKKEEDTLVCHLVGDHQDVKRYLREYRNR
jgi:mRNA-degrading endonuclease RelE of RelBE toxin-antitoxin system